MEFQGTEPKIYLGPSPVDKIFQGTELVYPSPTAYSAAILALNPAAYWRLGESSGTALVDETGTYPGTYHNSPTLGTPGLLVNDDNTAVSLNGTSQYIETTYGQGKQGTISISLIFDNLVSTNPAMNNNLFNSYEGTGSNLYMRLLTTGQLDVIRFNGGVVYSRITTAASYFSTKAHVVVTHEQEFGALRLYINGVLYGTDNSTVFIQNFANYYIGASPFHATTPANLCQGIIDEVAVFESELTQADVTDLYQKSIGN